MVFVRVTRDILGRISARQIRGTMTGTEYIGASIRDPGDANLNPTIRVDEIGTSVVHRTGRTWRLRFSSRALVNLSTKPTSSSFSYGILLACVFARASRDNFPFRLGRFVLPRAISRLRAQNFDARAMTYLSASEIDRRLSRDINDKFVAGCLRSNRTLENRINVNSRIEEVKSAWSLAFLPANNYCNWTSMKV